MYDEVTFSSAFKTPPSTIVQSNKKAQDGNHSPILGFSFIICLRYDRGSERKNSISLSLGKLAKP